MFTFWAWVAVVGAFGLGHLIGGEIEARQRWREWERARQVACPVGDLSGVLHTFRAGSGVVVPWSVMGDRRDCVEVCRRCASGGEL